MPGQTRRRVRRRVDRRKQRRIRRIRIAAVALVLFIVVAAIAALVFYLGPVRSAQAKARDAQVQFDLARGQVSGGVSHLTPQRLRTIQGEVARASADVASIQDTVSRFSIGVDLLSSLPVAGTRVATARHVLDVATDALDAAVQASQSGSALLALERSHGSGGLNHALLRVLIAQDAALARAQADLSAAASLSATVPATTGLGTSADHLLAVLRRNVGPASQALSAVRALSAVARHDTRILLVSQDANEQRATGGFIGFAGLVRMNASGLRLARFIRSTDVDPQYAPAASAVVFPPGSIPAPDAGEQIGHWEAWLFRDGNWSPDFPTAAQQLELFYQRGQHLLPDGVVAVEPDFLVRMLAVTGPVRVPGRKDVLTTANVLAVIYQREYFDNDTQFVNDAFRAVIDNMLALPSNRVGSLAQALLDALHAHDVLIYMNDPRLETLLRRDTVAGAINQAPGDYLYLVDSNLGYNKLDAYIRRTAFLTVHRNAAGLLEHTLTLTYTNTWPAGRWLGKRGGGSHTSYIDYLRVLVPAGSVLNSTDGWVDWAPGTELNRSWFAGQLYIPGGQTRKVTLHYTVPARAVPTGSYTIHVQAQPGGSAAAVSVCLVQPGTSSVCSRTSAQDFEWKAGR